MVYYAMPYPARFSRGNSANGYSKEKVAIHEWHLYMQAVEHSPNIRRLRMRYAACKSQIAGTSKSASQLKQGSPYPCQSASRILLLLLFIALRRIRPYPHW